MPDVMHCVINPNWPPDIFDVAFVPLTEGKFTTIDLSDLPIASHFEWSYHRSNRSNTGYAVTRFEGRPLFMHRLFAKAGPASDVDHWDMNGLNNRRRNIRPATHSENQANRPKPKRGTQSRFKGVRPQRGTKRWEASITVRGKYSYLGSFASEEEAALAYNAAALAAWGEYAQLTVVPADLG